MEKVSLIKWVKDRPVRTPITLSKVQLLDGQYAYYHHDPEYMLLPKASDRAPMLKQRACCVEIEFTPVGNPRKMLDITVVFVPDQNPEGQTGWNPWYAFGSKKEFIKKHNQLEKRILASPNAPKGECTLLREEDFD